VVAHRGTLNSLRNELPWTNSEKSGSLEITLKQGSPACAPLQPFGIIARMIIERRSVLIRVLSDSKEARARHVGNVRPAVL
jgi:hypothetical protein